MSKRSQVKRITLASRTLEFLREQADLSLRQAALASRLGDSVIDHLEHGRIDVREHHLEKLLPAYGVLRLSFDMFAKGQVQLPENIRLECLELVKVMSHEQLRTALPVLSSLAKQRS